MVISEVELTTSADKTSRAIQAPIGAATLPTLSIYVRSLDLIGWTYYRTRCISSPCYYQAKSIFKCAVNSKTHWIVNLVCFCSCLSFIACKSDTAGLLKTWFSVKNFTEKLQSCQLDLGRFLFSMVWHLRWPSRTFPHPWWPSRAFSHMRLSSLDDYEYK